MPGAHVEVTQRRGIGGEEPVLEIDVDPVVVVGALIECLLEALVLVGSDREVDVAAGTQPAGGVPACDRPALQEQGIDAQAPGEVQDLAQA